MSDTPVTPPAPDNGPDPVIVKSSWLWIKNSKGEASVSTTFATVAFIITSVAYVMSIVSKLGSIEIRPFDVAACGAYFGPLMALYFSRRWTEAKYGNSKSDQ